MPLLVSYTSLEPAFSQTFTQNGQAVGFSTDAAVSLFASTSFLYTMGIMLSVVAAGVMYARAGVWRMEASERGVKKSNEEIKRTTLGLLGVLSLFVIIYTFNRDLLTGEVGLADLRANPAGSEVSTQNPTATPPVIQPTNGTEEANWAALRAAGIIITSTSGQTTPCTQEQLSQARPTCTSLNNMPQSVITMLIQLKDTCGGQVVVVGGTEPGHRTHGPGLPVVDIDDASRQLNECIGGNKFVAGPTLGFCNYTRIGLGFTFCNERGTSHWHVFK